MDEKYLVKYNDGLHLLGRVSLIVAVILFILFPYLINVIFGGAINFPGFIRGFINVALIYIPVSIVEFLVYAPILGNGGTYITFITGNVTNMKIPCAMNARDICGTKPNTHEDEIVTTIAVSVSAITTMLVVIIGVVLLAPLTPILNSAVLRPAFDNVVAALFGALGLKYFLKNLKVSGITLVIMSLLCIFIPALIPQTSFLIIPSGGMAIVLAYLFHKRGLKNEN